ncbi:hypothetical protein F3Y22_tig00117012pilonHSYRG00118 [Hibiscus syriacus]|uniref:Cell growth-regulating nucleolar protein-like winged helix domain-containing protein n=1 Tax=Hibiscus syriacus TaxID=106335 RepID=A0A6A2WCJ7_HIBSY|nr:hypothetical protein F3Y22_tig00117012pilonHSYRG00118 [Hibiscus syriacus]
MAGTRLPCVEIKSDDSKQLPGTKILSKCSFNEQEHVFGRVGFSVRVVQTRVGELSEEYLQTQRRRRIISELGDHCGGRNNITDETGNGEVTHMEKEKAKKSKHNAVKEGIMDSALTKEDTKKKIKWNKQIKEALKSSPDGVLKMRKLQKTGSKGSPGIWIPLLSQC